MSRRSAEWTGVGIAAGVLLLLAMLAARPDARGWDVSLPGDLPSRVQPKAGEVLFEEDFETGLSAWDRWYPPTTEAACADVLLTNLSPLTGGAYVASLVNNSDF